MTAYVDEGYVAQYDMYADVGMDMDMGIAQVDYAYQCAAQEF